METYVFRAALLEKKGKSYLTYDFQKSAHSPQICHISWSFSLRLESPQNQCLASVTEYVS